MTRTLTVSLLSLSCFNPCFGGSYIVTVLKNDKKLSYSMVSILVLVDLIL